MRGYEPSRPSRSKNIVYVGIELFRFETFAHWVDKAHLWFGTGTGTICVDAKNRICENYKDFRIAQDEDTFPVRVCRIRQEDDA